jgi:3-hydroxyacyl-[acyl-carrier-protein] dehydratase
LFELLVDSFEFKLQHPMTHEAILAAIPHRPPFLFLDEILEQSSDRILCRKTFSPSEFFYEGHYPGHPLTPGVILCEAALQAGAVLLSQQGGAAGGMPVATRMNEVKFKKMVRPGDTIEIEVTVSERLADAFFMTGKVTVGGKLAARLEFACALTQIQG